MNGSPNGTLNGDPLLTIPEETPAFESGTASWPRAAGVPSAHARSRSAVESGTAALAEPGTLGPAARCTSSRRRPITIVAALNLSGHNNREARTIARALELGVSEFGATYFRSKSARCSFGAFSLSWWRQRAARRPRRGEALRSSRISPAMASAPTCRRSCRRAPREPQLEYQLEALLAGKMPDKGEKNKKQDGRGMFSRRFGFGRVCVSLQEPQNQKRLASLRKTLGLPTQQSMPK